MVRWNSHADKPDHGVTAVIAIDEHGRDATFLLPELFSYNGLHGLWFGEQSGLLLKHASYRWAREVDIIGTLP